MRVSSLHICRVMVILANLEVSAGIFAAILDFRVTLRSNHVKNYFIEFSMVQNMGVEPIFVFL